MTGDPVTEVEKILGYRFTDRTLLQKALTHGSFEKRNHGNDYERLEFLGDSVLELVTREYLLAEYPDESEGDLTRRKIRIVQKENLAGTGRRLGLDGYACVGKGFVSSESAVDSLAADMVESVIGAVYIDSDLERAREFITREILELSTDSGPHSDARSELQEYCQGRGIGLPEYLLIGRSGPDHSLEFEMEVRINGSFAGRGTGKTRRAAREQAAADALKKLERMV